MRKFNDYIDIANKSGRVGDDFFELVIESYPDLPSAYKLFFDKNAEINFEYLSTSLMLIYREYLIRESLERREVARKAIDSILTKVGRKIYYLDNGFNDNVSSKPTLYEYSRYNEVKPSDVDYFCSLVKLTNKYSNLISEKTSRGFHETYYKFCYK